MKFEDIQEDLEIFDTFVNIAVSSKLKDVDVIQVIRSYNKIRDFINAKLDKDDD